VREKGSSVAVLQTFEYFTNVVWCDSHLISPFLSIAIGGADRLKGRIGDRSADIVGDFFLLAAATDQRDRRGEPRAISALGRVARCEIVLVAESTRLRRRIDCERIFSLMRSADDVDRKDDSDRRAESQISNRLRRMIS
jgi:hypothetical protein